MTDTETDATQGGSEEHAAAPPAVEVSDTGAENEATATEAEAAAGEEQTEEKPKQKPWFQRRIDELTRQRYEAERRAEAALQLLQGKGEGEEPKPGEKLSEAEVERRALAKAQELAAEQAFNQECNRIYEAGVKAFSDFDDAIQNFRMLGGLTPPMIEAAAATDMPEKVLYELGSNPDEAERIIKMTPTRMGVELAKLAQKLSAPKPAVSKAPPPIKPVDGAGKGEKDPDKMSDAEWMEWRNKQIAARRAG